MEGIFTYIGGLFSLHHDNADDVAILMAIHLILVTLIVILISKMATKSLRAVPTGTQNVMEAFLGGVIAMGKDVIGEEHARKYVPLIATIGLFVLVSNLIGIIPGFESPTSNINVTLTLALLVFLYYNYEGVKKQGAFRYLKNFVHLGEMNPIAKFAMSLLMYPIEIVSHVSRIISLSFRLFGNIKGDDLFLWVLLMLTPWIIPITPLVLLTFMAFLQTFVFMILTYVYLAGALALEEDH